MAVVKRYVPTRYDLYRDLLVWLRRREGPRLEGLPSSPRPAALAAERRRLASLAAEEVVLHLARRSAARRPTVEELEGLLGWTGGRQRKRVLSYRDCPHPRITGGYLRLGRRRRVRALTFWGRSGSLDVSVAFLRRHFGTYELTNMRDDPTDLRFAYFRGGRLRLVRASSRHHYKKPAASPAATPGAATGARTANTILVLDLDSRSYRPKSEDEEHCSSFTLSFDLSGGLGPYGLGWIKRRTVSVPDPPGAAARKARAERSAARPSVDPS